MSPGAVTDTDLRRSSMVQMHRDHAGRLGYSCFLSVVWGCQRAADYAIKGRLIHATQPLFVFEVACQFLRVIFK
jgi:hypothetical protein